MGVYCDYVAKEYFMENYYFFVVKISDFLSFKSSNVPLMSNPIVVSRNGFGKTAVCKAVAFALGLNINTDIKNIINYGKDKTSVSVEFRNIEDEKLTITRKYYKDGRDLFFIDEKEVTLSEVRKIFPEEDFCVLNENMSKEEILKNLDGEYKYFIFDNIDAQFSKKELENTLIPKLERILDDKSGFLTTNSEIVLENIGYTEVHINYKKHIGSVCSKVSLVAALRY